MKLWFVLKMDLSSVDIDLLVSNLTGAATVLTNSGPPGNSGSFKEAEALFLCFKETPEIYSVALQILDRTNNPYVLFHALSVIGDSITKEWRTIQMHMIRSTVQRILTFCFDSENWNLESIYVYRQAHKTVAVICKRSLTEIGDEHLDPGLELTSDVINACFSLLKLVGNSVKVLHGVSVLEFLVMETASVPSSTFLSVPGRAHYRCKKLFQERFLLSIWKQLISSAAVIFSSSSSALTKDHLVRSYLSSLSTIMSWNFQELLVLHVDDISIGASEERSLEFRPTKTWTRELVDQVHINTFFQIYQGVLQEKHNAAIAMNCLAQLASVTGSFSGGGLVLDEDDSGENIQAVFLTMFLRNLLQVDFADISGELAHETAALFCNLASCIPMSAFSGVEEELVRRFLELFSGCTTKIAENSLSEENSFSDERPFSDAFEMVLSSWANLVIQASLSSTSVDGMELAAQKILETFLLVHLSPPIGHRQLAAKELSEDVFTDIQECDRVLYSDQLVSVAELGRFSIKNSAPLLTDVADKLSSQLENALRILRDNHFNSGAFSQSGVQQSFDSLMEDLNWIVAITGNFLFGGEEHGVDIPHSILMFSLSWSGTSIVDAETKTAFENVQQGLEGRIPSNADPILRLMFGQFRLFNMLMLINESGCKELLSPELLVTVLWFQSKWTKKYLAFSKSHYAEVPESYNSLFGKDSSSITFFTNKFINSAKAYLSNWTGEKDVCKEAVEVFASLAHNANINLVSFPTAQRLIQDFVSFKPYVKSLFCPIKRQMAAALGSAVLLHPDSATRLQLWEQLTSVFHTRITTILTAKVPAQVNEVVEVCQVLLGIVSAMESSVDEKDMMQYVQPLSSASLQMARKYPFELDILCATVEIFDFTIASVSPGINAEDLAKLMEDVVLLGKTWAEYVAGGHPEDSDCQEVVFYASMVASAAYCVSRQTDLEKGKCIIAALARCVADFLMALDKQMMLAIPEVFSSYFSVMRNIAQFSGNALLNLSEKCCAGICNAVQFAFTTPNKSTVEPCSPFLYYLGGYCSKQPLNSLPARNICETARICLQILLKSLFGRAFPATCVLAAAEGLFGLLCYRKQDYEQFLDNFVRSLPLSELQPVIISHTQNLIPIGVKFIANHACMADFQNHFVPAYFTLKSLLVLK